MAAILAIIGLPGPTEMVIVLFIILILFGSRLPSLMRNLGRSAVEFKKGVQGVDEDESEAPQDVKGR
jgi:sec-independent protein translocase protein TatA